MSRIEAKPELWKTTLAEEQARRQVLSGFSVYTISITAEREQIVGIYAGMSKDPIARWLQHCRGFGTCRTPLYQATIGMSPDCIQFEVVLTGLAQRAAEVAEALLITHLKRRYRDRCLNVTVPVRALKAQL